MENDRLPEGDRPQVRCLSSLAVPEGALFTPEGIPYTVVYSGASLREESWAERYARRSMRGRDT